MSVIDPLICERCERPLESDDAISVIEGVCGICRNTAQSLVQPVRADQILSKGQASRGAFLDDLPSLNSVRSASEPWLVEVSSVARAEENKKPSAFIPLDDGPAVSIRSDDDDVVDVQGADDYELATYAARESDHGFDQVSVNDEGGYEQDAHFDEPYRVHLDESEKDESSLIPPGPYSTAKRRTVSRSPDLDEISEIFSPDSVPPSEMLSSDAEEDLEARVDIHRFNPPPPRKSTPPSKQSRKRQRRSRSLRAGILLGIVVVAVGTYGLIFSDWQNRIEDMVASIMPQRTSIETPIVERGVQLLVDPAGAEVFVDGFSIGNVDEQGRLELTKDDLVMAKNIEVRAPGYHQARLSINDVVGSPESVIRLLRKPFQVAVNSTPAGANILVDGQLVGQTPSTITIATEQSNVITLKKPGFEPFERDIPAPTTSDVPVALDAPLVRAGVVLTVSTAPIPAEIWMDGRFLGMAPIEKTLPAEVRGRDVEIVARAIGFDDTRTHIEIPLTADEKAAAELTLARTMARVNVRTNPPGGRIVVAGRDYGFAPALIEFEPSQTGRAVVLDANSHGEYFGRHSIVVPPPGAPHEFVIEMQRSAQRVVFVMAADRVAGAERFVLIDELAQHIERLDESHRFAVVAATDEGVEAWPYEVAFENASDEQKIRAFDMIRSIRAADEIVDDTLLNSVAQLDPSVVWIFTTVDIERAALESFADIFPADKQIAINVVKSRSSGADTWLDGFVARHGGALTTLDTVAAVNAYE